MIRIAHIPKPISQLSDKSRVLSSLVKEDVTWKWDADQQISLKTLKKV